MEASEKKKIYRLLIVLSVSLNVVCALLYFRSIYDDYRNQSLPPSAVQYWMKRDELFKSLPKDSGEIIFLGNSLTELFPLDELFRNPKIKNRGIVGDVSEGVLNRLHEVVDSHPSKVFIEVGINDIGLHITHNTTCTNYEKIIQTILKETPHTRIYVQSLLPVQRDNYLYGNINPSIVKLNNYLQKITAQYKITYVDLYSSFLKNEQLSSAYTIDGLHLNGEGYLLWKKLIEKEVNEE